MADTTESSSNAYIPSIYIFPFKKPFYDPTLAQPIEERKNEQMKEEKRERAIGIVVFVTLVCRFGNLGLSVW